MNLIPKRRENMPEGHDKLKGKRGTLDPSGHCPKQGTAHTALQGVNTDTG